MNSTVDNATQGDQPKSILRRVAILAIVLGTLMLLSMATTIENWKRDLTTNHAQLVDESADPLLRPVTLPHAPDEVAESIMSWVTKRPGWTVESLGGKGELKLHLTRTTRIMRFTDDIHVRLIPVDEQTRVEAESQSRIGKGDLGQNPRNLRELTNALLKGETFTDGQLLDQGSKLVQKHGLVAMEGLFDAYMAEPANLRHQIRFQGGFMNDRGVELSLLKRIEAVIRDESEPSPIRHCLLDMVCDDGLLQPDTYFGILEGLCQYAAERPREFGEPTRWQDYRHWIQARSSTRKEYAEGKILIDRALLWKLLCRDEFTKRGFRECDSDAGILTDLILANLYTGELASLSEHQEYGIDPFPGSQQYSVCDDVEVLYAVTTLVCPDGTGGSLACVWDQSQAAEQTLQLRDARVV